jgi:hypothetical protein
MAATLLGWTGITSDAQEVKTSSPGPLWDYSLTARTAAGYKDNVTLAHLSPEASGFAETGLEFIAFRLPPEGMELNFLGSFDDRRFFSAPSVDKEQVGFGQAEASWRFGDWQAALSLEYLYQDQYLDVSVTETNLEAVRVVGPSLLARPGIRREIAPSCWVEMQFPVQRQLLQPPLDDTWEGGPRISVGTTYGNKSELSLSYEGTYRVYDNEPDYTAEGEPIPGTRRKTWTHRTDWTWRHYWDPAQTWRTTTRFTWKLNTDDADGYFDYSAVQLAQQFRYKAKGWEALGDIRLAHYEYPVQTVSPTSLLRRERDELLVNFRLEKTLVKWLRVFTAYEREQVFSNLDAEQFTANTITGGFLWDF